MSLLSPKKIHIGLCCGKCWLRVGGRMFERTTEIDINADSNALLGFFVQALSSMLTEAKHEIRPKSVVSIIVSDRLGVISALPWQDVSMTKSELNSFAIFWLAKFGAKIDDSYLLFADYPQFQKIGIAYALPKAFVESLVSVVEFESLKLERVIPLSAAVFYSAHLKRMKPSTLVVCEETHSLSSWIRDLDGKLHYEVEPVTSTQDGAMKRLLARTCVRYKELGELNFWGVAKERVPSELKDSSPSVTLVNTLERECWIKS